MKFRSQLTFYIVLLCVCSALSDNKYSRKANEKKTDKKKDVEFRTLEKPFRMNKINMVWVKAQQRLTEPKLKSLYSDLMIQDKEEATLKRVRGEGGDKEGMKEAELRRKLTQIMANYGLREHFEDNKMRHKEASYIHTDDHINKSLFKDKKLNQLWSKAEVSGFTSEELAALKEEFMHHQDKIDQYYDLLDKPDTASDTFKNAVDEEELDAFNEVGDRERLETNEINKEYLHKANLVRDKHRGIRDGYDRLQRITAQGPTNKEFIEPKVQGLWRAAASANFTVDELASLRVELQHYQSRLLKLRHLQADHVRNLEKHAGGKIAAAGDKMDHFADQQQMIKKHSRKVEKMEADLENKILSRHSEL